MARQAEKQLAKSNVTKIAFLRNAALGVNVIFVLVRLVWCFRSTTKKTWFLYIVTNIVACMIHFQLVSMGTPKFTTDGSLRSAGEDLSQAGLTEYLTDIVYMTWIIYALVACVTDYAWLLYLAIPGYAVFKGWPMLRPLVKQAKAQVSAAQQGRNAKDVPGQTSETEMSKRQTKLKARQDKFSSVRAR